MRMVTLAQHLNVVLMEFTNANAVKSIKLRAHRLINSDNGGSFNFLFSTLKRGGVGYVTDIGNSFPKATA